MTAYKRLIAFCASAIELNDKARKLCEYPKRTKKNDGGSGLTKEHEGHSQEGEQSQGGENVGWIETVTGERIHYEGKNRSEDW